MIHYGMFFKPGLRGLHTGYGTYSYLPFACRVGRIRFHLSFAAGASISLEQGGTLLGDPMGITPGLSDIFEPDTTTVIPGVDASNLDTTARLSLRATIFGHSAANTRLRYAVELIPVDATFAEAEIWQVYATGEDHEFSTLVFLNSDFNASFPPTPPDEEEFCNGYVEGEAQTPIFNNKASGSEDSINGDMNAGGFKIGVGTPLAAQRVLSHLMVVSSDPAGFDGDYTFACRRNGNSVLAVSPVSGGTRIYSNSGTATYAQGSFFDWMAVGTSGGTMVKGHLLCVVRPGVDGGEAGLGAFGLGQRGLGG